MWRADNDRKRARQKQIMEIEAMRKQWETVGKKQQLIPAPYQAPFPSDRDLPPKVVEVVDIDTTIRIEHHLWPGRDMSLVAQKGIMSVLEKMM